MSQPKGLAREFCPKPLKPSLGTDVDAVAEEVGVEGMGLVEDFPTPSDKSQGMRLTDLGVGKPNHRVVGEDGKGNQSHRTDLNSVSLPHPHHRTSGDKVLSDLYGMWDVLISSTRNEGGDVEGMGANYFNLH